MERNCQDSNERLQVFSWQLGSVEIIDGSHNVFKIDGDIRNEDYIRNSVESIDVGHKWYRTDTATDDHGQVQ